MKEIKLLLLITLMLICNACSKDEDKDSEVWKNKTVKMFDNTTIECIDNSLKQGIIKIKFKNQWNPQESDALYIDEYKTIGYEDDVYFLVFNKVEVLGDVLKVGLNLSNPLRTEYVYFEIINENTLKANGYTYKKYSN